MSDHFDTILKRLDSQDKQIEQLRKRTEQLERARPDEELHQINSDLNDLEMRSRSRNLEIHGKLFNEHENLLQKINEIARMIQVPELWCSVAATATALCTLGGSLLLIPSNRVYDAAATMVRLPGLVTQIAFFSDLDHGFPCAIPALSCTGRHCLPHRASSRLALLVFVIRLGHMSRQRPSSKITAWDITTYL
ncbi:hypothetical protein HPB51_023215 [Rhipicephalus microplus]|uniref:Uncharacterized protein n=1 Tax=Rhipicephalus microplus TaxID=6941 RepID=A0A9J6ECR0_RHIMP|nr:hypothetical protein HPB51_023215 [Rhipicephalus microplus]